MPLFPIALGSVSDFLIGPFGKMENEIFHGNYALSAVDACCLIKVSWERERGVQGWRSCINQGFKTEDPLSVFHFQLCGKDNVQW